MNASADADADADADAVADADASWSAFLRMQNCKGKNAKPRFILYYQQ